MRWTRGEPLFTVPAEDLPPIPVYFRQDDYAMDSCVIVDKDGNERKADPQECVGLERKRCGATTTSRTGCATTMRAARTRKSRTPESSSAEPPPRYWEVRTMAVRWSSGKVLRIGLTDGRHAYAVMLARSPYVAFFAMDAGLRDGSVPAGEPLSVVGVQCNAYARGGWGKPVAKLSRGTSRRPRASSARTAAWWIPA